MDMGQAIPGDAPDAHTSTAGGSSASRGAAEGAVDSPIAPSADASELPPVATYRRAIEQSLANMVGTVTAPLRSGQQTYRRLMSRMVSGGEMLGPVEDGEVGDEGTEKEAAGGGAQQPGAEALLALTLEAYTDICRYPRCAPRCVNERVYVPHTTSARLLQCHTCTCILQCMPRSHSRDMRSALAHGSPAALYTRAV